MQDIPCASLPVVKQEEERGLHMHVVNICRLILACMQACTRATHTVLSPPAVEQLAPAVSAQVSASMCTPTPKAMPALPWQVYACATHAVLSPPAVERLASGVFSEVIVTNTIPTPESKMFPQLTILSVASLLAETIWRVHNSTSVQALRENR